MTDDERIHELDLAVRTNRIVLLITSLKERHLVGRPIHITERSVWMVVDAGAGVVEDRFIPLNDICSVKIMKPQPERGPLS